jgi:hypothetical protein
MMEIWNWCLPIPGAILPTDFSNRLEAATNRQLPHCVLVAAWNNAEDIRQQSGNKKPPS